MLPCFTFIVTYKHTVLLDVTKAFHTGEEFSLKCKLNPHQSRLKTFACHNNTYCKQTVNIHTVQLPCRVRLVVLVVDKLCGLLSISTTCQQWTNNLVACVDSLVFKVHHLVGCVAQHYYYRPVESESVGRWIRLVWWVLYLGVYCVHFFFCCPV